MAGGAEAVYRDHGFPIPFGLVLQLSAELAPPGVGDGLRQTVVLYHVLRSQVLNADDVVFTDKLCGQFVRCVLPLVGNMLVKPCYLQSGLFPAVAPL